MQYDLAIDGTKMEYPYPYPKETREADVQVWLWRELTALGYDCRMEIKVGCLSIDLLIFDDQRQPALAIEVKKDYAHNKTEKAKRYNQARLYRAALNGRCPVVILHRRNAKQFIERLRKSGNLATAGRWAARLKSGLNVETCEVSPQLLYHSADTSAYLHEIE